MEPEDEDNLDSQGANKEKPTGGEPGNQNGEKAEEDKQKGKVNNGSDGTAGTTKNQSVNRVLLFDNLVQGTTAQKMECNHFLKALELDDLVGEEIEEAAMDTSFDHFGITNEDNELVSLPEEWVYDIQQQKIQGDEEGESSKLGSGIEATEVVTGEEVAENWPALGQKQPSPKESVKTSKPQEEVKGKKKNTQQKWGPVMAVRRSSRNIDGDKKVSEKAQEAKRKWNLEGDYESEVDEYGNTLSQDSWDFAKLDAALPTRKEKYAGTIHSEFQIGSQDGVLATSISQARSCISENQDWETVQKKLLEYEEAGNGANVNWWTNLNEAMQAN